jgi:hypothetical protein
MVRVLKPGGRLAIHEIGDVTPYRNVLSEAGVQNVVQSATTLPFGLGGKILQGSK